MIMPRQEEMILTDRENVEELRQLLLDEIWAGAASGLGAVLLDEQEIRKSGLPSAVVEELQEREKR